MSDSPTPQPDPKDPGTQATNSAGSPRRETPGEPKPDPNTPQKPEGKQPPKKKGPPFYKRPGVMAILLGVLIVVIIGLILFWRYSRAHQTTDDAYVDVVSEAASPQISGRVIKVAVQDNQQVRAGDLLVELDPSDYEARLEQARAQRAQSDAQVKQAQAQKSVYQAQVEEAKASLETAQANSTNASRQWERIQTLKGVNPGAVSAEQWDSAQAASVSAQAQLNAAHKQVGAAEAQVGYANSLMEAAQAGGRSAEATIREAELTLSYTKVFARTDGQIASRTVAEGNIVAAGTPLMAVVPTGGVYITANFKETQLDHMRVGQPVEIKVDAYPELKLTGRVNSIEAASGQAFSAIPAQNATGNWVKVVQRVPVKITFDRLPEDSNIRLGPGMSVEVAVKVR